MGACTSSPDPGSQVNKAINKQLADLYNKARTSIKMLLLGAGESGKSTCMRQMQILDANGLSVQDRMQKIDLVRQNTLQAIHMLCEAVDTYKLEWQRELSQEYADGLRQIRLENVCLEHKEQINYLWDDSTINKDALAFASEINLLDSACYFLDRINETFDTSYVPSEQDVLRTRAPTCGVAQHTFSWGEMDVNVFDVGGQRGQRKKWINCFEDVTAVIFVASLSEYDQKLEEDNESNRMVESLKLFQAINELRWFEDTATIIFFNKEDIFREKLRTSKISDYFPEYQGDNDFISAAKFIEEMYLERTKKESGKQLYGHITKATDTELMRVTMKAVQHYIMAANLKKANLIL